MADESYPDELKYHPEHDWARIEGDQATFGITWYAQDALGEVVFFDPPEVGSQVSKDQAYAEVESVKAVSDVFAPLSGEIVEVNSGLEESPERVNEDPYGEGWMVKVRLSDPGETDDLLDVAAYRDLLKSESVTQYTSTTEQDRREMLRAIGVGSLEDLFAEIPDGVRLKRALDLPAGMSEQEVFDHLSELAARNRHADGEVTFLGAGMYDHYVPALIDSILQRSEFLTPYTPYQPEISQGGLQVMFEFQTAISELTGLPVSNASVYEGPSAVAAAGYMAKLENGRTKLVTSRGLHPHSRQALLTHAAGYHMEVVEVRLNGDGATDAEALADAVDDDTAAVFVQQPNFLGTVEDLGALAERAKATGGLFVCAADPLPLGILTPPGELGVDICVGEGQTLGNRLDFGGPSFGFFAADERFIRRMPGRISGETRDVDGKRGFVLTLQTREQHIRREKATHNICTAQALNALAGTIYLSWLGKRGLVELATLMLRRTAYAREQLGLEPINPGPVVREFAVRVPDLDALFERARAEGINPGYRLGRDYPEYGDGLLVAVTERRTREQIDRLAEIVTRERVAA